MLVSGDIFQLFIQYNAKSFVPTCKVAHLSHCVKCMEVHIIHYRAGIFLSVEARYRTSPLSPLWPQFQRMLALSCLTPTGTERCLSCDSNQQKLSSGFEHCIKVRQLIQLNTVTINAAVLRWVNATKSCSLGLWMADVIHPPQPPTIIVFATVFSFTWLRNSVLIRSGSLVQVELYGASMHQDLTHIIIAFKALISHFMEVMLLLLCCAFIGAPILICWLNAAHIGFQGCIWVNSRNLLHLRLFCSCTHER